MDRVGWRAGSCAQGQGLWRARLGTVPRAHYPHLHGSSPGRAGVFFPHSQLPRQGLAWARGGKVSSTHGSAPGGADHDAPSDPRGPSIEPSAEEQPGAPDTKTTSQEPGAARPTMRRRRRPSTLARVLLQFPLELSSILSKEDAHYLEKRARRRWWSRRSFPRVPTDTLEVAHRTPPPLAVWQKVLPLGAIFFAASFNLTILANLKDAIMVTTAGAETLPWLASCGILPASIAFFVAYGTMVERLPQRAVFYAAVAPLLAAYALFAGALYPAHAFLHPVGLTAALAGATPPGLHGALKMVEHWTFSLFYCAAELWGSVVISILFWSLANEVCTVNEAKAVYPLMGIAANVALVIAGSYLKWVNASVAHGNTQLMLNVLVGTVIAMSGVMAVAKFVIDTYVVGPYCSLDERSSPKVLKKKKKNKGSLANSLSVLKESPKVRNLAMLVVSYSVSHRLFEFAWKGALRTLHPTPGAYQSVLADVAIATGYATIALMLLSRYVFQYAGWAAAAAATPTVMLVTGGAFFGLSIAAGAGLTLGSLGPLQLAALGVGTGVATQVFARSAKFSLFDPAKEMVYIEMTPEEKSKGKAAVDLLGSQIGKSGGAWITQGLILVSGSITASLPLISAVFLATLTTWLGAVRSLARQIADYEAEKQAREEAGDPSAGTGGEHARTTPPPGPQQPSPPPGNGAHADAPTARRPLAA
ncbi:hypothetical protein ACKKBG_A31875 [Auxenochlorella protothecoides x Auxenochlorella symbiontica]